MKKEIFEQIARIKLQIKGLQEAEKKFTEMAIEDMKKEDIDSIDLTNDDGDKVGTFSYVTRSYWKYDDTVKDAVKAIQQEAKNGGLATESVTESLRYLPVKTDETF